jgi:hypothetical protein
MATGAEMHAHKMEERKLEKQVRLRENAFFFNTDIVAK